MPAFNYFGIFSPQLMGRGNINAIYFMIKNTYYVFQSYELFV
jgi:hypothetical protein